MEILDKATYNRLRQLSLKGSAQLQTALVRVEKSLAHHPSSAAKADLAEEQISLASQLAEEENYREYLDRLATGLT